MRKSRKNASYCIAFRKLSNYCLVSLSPVSTNSQVLSEVLNEVLSGVLSQALSQFMVTLFRLTDAVILIYLFLALVIISLSQYLKHIQYRNRENTLISQYHYH